MSGKLFIVSAPSCAGKTSLVQELLKSDIGGRLSQYTTYTTKLPREGDVPGKDFHFVSQEEFLRRVRDGFFIEWSNAYCHYYGTPRDIKHKLNDGRSFIIILDRVGTKKILEEIPSAITIWIFVSSIEELRSRMQLRGADGKEQMLLRMSLAEKEMLEEQESPFYKFHINNSKFFESLAKLTDIIEKNIK